LFTEGTERIQAMQLITVGTVAFDRIETPFGTAEKTVGGAATYISLAASIFLDKMGLVSVVGDDFPVPVMRQLEKRGVDLSGLEILKGKESFFWAGRYHYDMNSRDTLETRLNVLLELDPKLPASYRKAPYVMLGNLDPVVQGKVLDQMDERPALVVMDTMNFWMDSALDKLKEVIRRVDILTINDAEARQLSGEHSLVKAAARIRPCVLRTRAALGGRDRSHRCGRHVRRWVHRLPGTHAGPRVRQPEARHHRGQCAGEFHLREVRYRSAGRSEPRGGGRPHPAVR
jgi:hypothetical protein